MVSKEEVKRFLSKLIPFVEKFPDITEKISKLEDDTEFQNLLGRLGTIGGLFSIGLYLFKETLDHFEDTEKTYYSLINRTAISVAEKMMKKDFKTDDEKNTKILQQMMKIYSFKESDKGKYQNWNGLVPYDHPIVKEFRHGIIQIIKENNLESRYQNFITEFNLAFKDEVKTSTQFSEYQKQKVRERLSKTRVAYYNWILDDLGEKETIDDIRPTNYYVQNRAVSLKIKDKFNNKDYWNISDLEAEEIFKDKKQWKIEYFLDSDNQFELVAAPFGTGKTTFAKHITRYITEKNLLGLEENTWIPIYLPLRKKLDTEYKSASLHQILKYYIQPQNENILLVCDGLDEYSSNPEDIRLLRDKLLNIQHELGSASIAISDLNIIFTSRPEAGFPEQLGVDKYIRLLPFTPEQVTEFFERYGHKELSFQDIKRYELQESSHRFDLLKPLFCWMFALSYRNLEITKNMDKGVARLILYSTFIHSILEGRYKGTPIEIVKEKWIMRKIAVLKVISEEVYEEDLSEKLQSFVEEEQRQFINLKDIKLHTVLTAYFKLNKKGNNKHSIDFLHKSFQEYLLAEFYVESILYNKGYRLNVGHPSGVTIEFLESLLSMIKDQDKKEYEKPLLRLMRSLYPNKADWSDAEIMQRIVKDLRNHLLDNTIKIFEENKIVFADFEDKTIKSEYWKVKDVSNYSEYYKNFIYKGISLFIIKKLDAERNPKSVNEYIKDSHKVLPFLKYFPHVNLKSEDLSGANLSGANLSGANLSIAKLSDANLSDAMLNEAHFIKVFTGANLSGIGLPGARLTDTKFWAGGTTITNLFGANLSTANLKGAYLADTYLSHAILVRADLEGAYLSGSNLSGADLYRADLSGADLSGAILTRAYIHGANLSRVNLSGAILTRAILTKAYLQEANLSGAYLQEANLSGAILTRANLSYTNLEEANLSGANLSGADLSVADLSGTKILEAIILRPINFKDLIIDDYTYFNASITDDKYLFDVLKSKIKSQNMPILVESKEELIKELKKKSYKEDDIERFVYQSKFSEYYYYQSSSVNTNVRTPSPKFSLLDN